MRTHLAVRHRTAGRPDGEGSRPGRRLTIGLEAPRALCQRRGEGGQGKHGETEEPRRAPGVWLSGRYGGPGPGAARGGVGIAEPRPGHPLQRFPRAAAEGRGWEGGHAQGAGRVLAGLARAGGFGARWWWPALPVPAMSRQSTLLRFFPKAASASPRPPAPAPAPAPPQAGAGTRRRHSSGEQNGRQAATSPAGAAGRAAARRKEAGEKGLGNGAAAKTPR